MLKAHVMNESTSSDRIFIAKLTEIVLDNLTDEGFSVERLAQEAGMSRVNLYRRLKAIKNQNVSKFIREVRLQRAMEMLRNKQGTAAEISYKVGFGSPAYFNKCFHEYFGYPPGKVKLIGSFNKKGKSVISKSWKIASYISFLVIVALIGLMIIPRTIRSELEKSIAVLPFINDSENKENEYFMNGLLDELLLDLQSIRELRVLSRNSVEQYRNNPKPITEIARKKGVNYIVGGSGQKYGDTIKLTVRLNEGATGTILWTDSYDEEIKGTEDIFNIQRQIAESIAAELKILITPEEKQLIEKPTTANLTAYDFYLRGKEEHAKHFPPYKTDTVAIERAKDLYHKAVEYDSTFAQAYVGLANVYWDKHYWETYFSENFLDSVLILADIALSYDDQLAEAYTVKGKYYSQFGKRDQAIEEYDNAIKFNPNDYQAYKGKGIASVDDFVNRIDNFQKAAFLNRGPELPRLLGLLAKGYLWAGFPEKGKFHIQEKFKLDGDSADYYSLLMGAELFFGNFEKAIKNGLKGYAIDSLHAEILIDLGNSYMHHGQHEESLKYFEKYIERLKSQGTVDIWYMHNIGYAYWQNGNKEKAEHYFNKQIKYTNRHHELDGTIIRYQNSTIYAFRGEKEKALEILRTFNQRKVVHKWFVTSLKYDPKFDSIRDEPEFQQIVKDVEAKYQAGHERVRKWLEENDMLELNQN